MRRIALAGCWVAAFVAATACSASQVTRNISASRKADVQITDLKRQPREVGGRCLGGAPRTLPPEAHNISRARADFDGDGLTDRFLVYDPTVGEEPVPDEPGSFVDFGPWRVRMELATGAVTDEYLDDESVTDPIGRADVNADGRDELLMWTDGGSGGMRIGSVFTLHECRVTAAVEEGRKLPFTFNVYGGPRSGGSEGFVCMNTDDDPAQEAIRTRVSIDSNGDGAQDSHQELARAVGPRRYQWGANVYELRGATMVLEDELETEFGASRPRRYRFDTGVQCGEIDGS